MIHVMGCREAGCHLYPPLPLISSSQGSQKLETKREDEFLLEINKVHENHREEEEECKTGGAWESLTVWRKSLLLNCRGGFTVIDCNGNLIFRVDNYAGRRPEEVVLMDGSGKPVLTVCRRNKLKVLVDNWFVYEGEVGDYSSTKPICCARKRITILRPRVNVIARIYHQPIDKRCAYTVEGKYGNRSCRVLDESRTVVAEIKPKESVNYGASFGDEVFLLIVRPEFSLSFAMAVVLLLDQMFS